MGANGRFYFFNKLGRLYAYDKDVFCVTRLPIRQKRITPLKSKKDLQWVQLFEGSKLSLTKVIKPKPSSLFLIISGACNLNCSYCFADRGRFGVNKGNLSMDTSMAFKALDYFFDHLCLSDQALICFYGGEPLLNWKTIRSSIEYAEKLAKRKGVSIYCSITTNGTCFNDEICNFFKARSNIIGLVSIDAANKACHDYLRPYNNGKGTYQDIIRALKKYPYLKKIFAPRATITRGNRNIYNYAKLFYKLGFDDAYFLPVISSDKSQSLRKSDLMYLKNEMEKMLSWNLKQTRKHEKPVKFGLSKALSILTESEPRRICKGGHSFVTVTPDGSIYPCHHLVYKKQYKLGTLKNGIDKARHIKLLNNHCCKKNTICSNCWASNLCGGCYYFEDLHQNASFSPYIICEWQRLVFENACVYYYEIMTQ